MTMRSSEAPTGARFFREMVGTIVQRGRALRERSLARAPSDFETSIEKIGALCRSLISRRGEASGVALAREILDRYQALGEQERLGFFEVLAKQFGPAPDRVERASQAYASGHSDQSLRELIRAVEPPRQEVFRRLNQAPHGTSDLVSMRANLLAASNPALESVDDDLVHLLTSWFNRGFLVLERISWASPADLLERIIRYEAVHMIQGWDDLRRRLQPPDRRCYAFFHPSLVDEPLIFVEIALTREIPSSIQQILATDRETVAADEARTAVFYSISNCQAGLRGISFGNLLIKQVVEELKRDLPHLSTFVTLSPAPGFARWLKQLPRTIGVGALEGLDLAPLALLDVPQWHERADMVQQVRPLMLRLAASYYLHAKGTAGQPADPVARFHLGNGARLEHIHWPGDVSQNGLTVGAGLMVNYLYDLRTIEKNHEAYWNSGSIAASPAIERLLR